MKRKLIQNCPPEIKEPCPVAWESLKSTDNENVRFCKVCDKNVYFCKDSEEVSLHAGLNHCVAMNHQVGLDLPILFLGKPRQVEYTERQMADSKVDMKQMCRSAVLVDLKYSNRCCIKCRFPIASFIRECRMCSGSKSLGFDMNS